MSYSLPRYIAVVFGILFSAASFACTVTPNGPTNLQWWNMVILQGDPISGLGRQWFINGLAIAGATSRDYYVCGSANPSGSYYYKDVDANGITTCISPSVSITTNQNTAFPNIIGANSVCVGLTTPLTNVATGGVWSSNNPSIATVDGGGVVTGISAGSVIISYAIYNACVPSGVISTSKTMYVQPGTLPSLQPITGPNSLCANTLAQYIVQPASGATSYTWTLPSGWQGSSSLNVINVRAGGTGGIISVTADNMCGSSTAQTMNASIISVDTAVLLSGDTLTATATNATFNWLRCDGSAYTSVSTARTFINVGNHSYRVIVTQNGCADTSKCMQLDSKVFIQNTLPTIPSLSDMTLWSGTDKQPAPVIKICADGSRATRICFVNRSLLPTSSLNFTLSNDPSGAAPQGYGYFSDLTVRGDSVSILYNHPSYLPYAAGLKRADAIKIMGGSQVQIMEVPIEVYRAPVLMIHGLWANSSSFDEMRQQLAASGYYKNELLQQGDYSYDEKNARHFAENADVVPEEIRILLREARANGYSVGKVDYVCHSMGGLLARQYIQSAIYRHDINKLITINTPHSGSQMANFVHDGPSAAVSMVTTLLGFINYDWRLGAIEDLRVNGPAMNSLNAYGSAPGNNYTDIASYAIGTHTDVLANKGWDALLSKQELIALALYNPQGLFNYLFYGDPNDAVVALPSQLGGFPQSSTSVFNPQIHLGACGNTAVIDEVLGLLETNSFSTRFHHDKYSAPALSSHYRGMSTHNTPTGAGTVKIIAPAFGSTFRAGQTITFSAASTGTVNRILFIARAGSTDVETYDTLVANANIQYTIPREAIGALKLAVMAGDSGGAVAYDTLIGTVEAGATLDSIKCNPSPITVGVNGKSGFHVQGYFADSVVRNLDGLAGISCLTADTFIAVHGSGNWVNGKQVGITSMNITYQDKSTAVPVEVIPEDTSIHLPPEQPAAIASYGRNQAGINKMLSIYPNPNNGTFRIAFELQKADEQYRIEIYDGLGRIVYTQVSKSSSKNINRELSLDHATAGVYYVRVVSSEGISTGKTVVRKP